MLRVGAKAVIEAENTILVLHPSEIDLNRKWHIPGGIRDNIEESIDNTAMREVLEETGVDLSNNDGRVFKVGEWLAVDKDTDVKILAIFFHYVLPEKPKITLSHEHDNFAWLDKSNYHSYSVNIEVNEIIEELL